MRWQGGRVHGGMISRKGRVPITPEACGEALAELLVPLGDEDSFWGETFPSWERRSDVIARGVFETRGFEALFGDRCGDARSSAPGVVGCLS